MDFRQSLRKFRDLCDAEQLDQALDLLNELIREYPGNSHLHLLRGQLLQVHEDDGELSDIKTDLELAVSFAPESSDALVELARFHDAVMDEPEIARSLFAKAMEVAANRASEAFEGQRDLLRELVEE